MVKIGELLVFLITLYEGLIILRAVLTWFTSPQTSHPAIDLLKRLTDPALEPVRKALPATGSIDLSPLVVLIGLELLKRFLA
ncbi:MAG: YggT family protein [Gemmatimonadota bacterium]|jgi:YggT family protein